MKKRIFSMLTALCLCLTLLPTAANAAAPTQPGMLSFLRYYNNDSKGVQPYSTANGYHYIYLGQWDNEPIKWRVLKIQDEISTRSKLFLLADECLGDSMLFNPSDKPDRYLWDGSAVQTWCKDFYNDAFTAADRALILSTDKTEEQYRNPPCPPCTITNEYVFAPSIWEINNKDYGFTDQASCIAGPIDSAGAGIPYWLRSHTKTEDTIPAFIDGRGNFTDDQTGSHTAAVRPAMNLNSSNNSFFLVSAAEGVKSAEGTEGGIAAVPSLAVNEWKLTLPDSSRRNFDAKVYDVGSDFYLAYTGATVGANEYISAYFTKLVNGSNVIAHYGRLGKVTGSSGVIKIAKADVPLDENFWVYNEQYNGDKFTDYASNLQLLNLGNTNICIPAINVTATLTNISSSNDAGFAAKADDYRVTLTPDEGYMLPKTITVTVGGTKLEMGQYTYESDGTLIIPAGYLNDVLHIEAAAVKKTWAIEVNPSQLVFDTASVGYEEFVPRFITVTNTGNQNVTLNLPAAGAQADNYVVNPGDGFANGQAALAPGASASFTLRPKTGLLNGCYDGQIDITTDHSGTSASVPVLFTVQEAVVNLSDIKGVTPPAAGVAPAAAITETGQYTGTVTWSPDDAAFDAGKQYTAIITLTPKCGYKLDGVAENFFQVSGATCTNAAGSGVITAVFPTIPRSSGDSHTPTYPVNVPGKTENGSVTASPKNASKGTTVTITVKPDSGYMLETISAADKNGNSLKLTDKGNGKYTFIMPGSKVEVKVTFMEDNSVLNFFYDVPNDAYYYEAVKWAAENGVTGGVGNSLFAPNQPCTRAQIGTFLWRAAGSPVVNYLMSFTDVDEGAYYAEAIRWAASTGIVTGLTETTFGANGVCTRAQVVTMLYRFAKVQGMDTTQGGMAIREFDDFDSVPAYALEAMDWAVNAGVLKGDNNRLLPQNACTRAQIVTLLWRAFSK